MNTIRIDQINSRPNTQTWSPPICIFKMKNIPSHLLFSVHSFRNSIRLLDKWFRFWTIFHHWIGREHIVSDFLLRTKKKKNRRTCHPNQFSIQSGESMCLFSPLFFQNKFYPAFVSSNTSMLDRMHNTF